MALRSKIEQGVWCPHRAREIERDLNSLAEMLEEIEELRQSISHQAWVAHERLWGLKLKVIDKRITHLMALQGMAPERSGLANMTPQQLRDKLTDYQKQLAHLANTFEGGKVIKIHG